MLRQEKFDLTTKLYDEQNNLVARIEQEAKNQWKTTIVGIGFYSLEKTKRQAISEVKNYLATA